MSGCARSRAGEDVRGGDFSSEAGVFLLRAAGGLLQEEVRPSGPITASIGFDLGWPLAELVPVDHGGPSRRSLMLRSWKAPCTTRRAPPAGAGS